MAAKGAAQPAKAAPNFEDIISTKSADKLQVFIMSWNMGNAPETGLQYVLSEKNANNAYDIIVLGLQESTYKTKDGTDCVAQLSMAVENIIGQKYFKVQCIYYLLFLHSVFLFSCSLCSCR